MIGKKVNVLLNALMLYFPKISNLNRQFLKENEINFYILINEAFFMLYKDKIKKIRYIILNNIQNK